MAGCDVLIAAAAESGVVLEVFQQRRWEADFQLLLRLVHAGRIGQVWRFEVARFHRGPYRSAGASGPHDGDVVVPWAHSSATGGGISFVVGPHPVDHLLTLMGRPERVRGRVRVAPGEDVDEWIGIDTDFAGATGTVDVWRSARDSPPRFVAHGSEGTIVARDGTSLEILEPDGHTERIDGLPAPGRLGEEIYRGLAAAIRGEGDVAVGAASGRLVVDVIESALRSARTAAGG